MYTIMYEGNHGFACKPQTLTFERRKRKQLSILVGRRLNLAGVPRLPGRAFAFNEEGPRRAAVCNRELEERGKLLAAEGVPVCCQRCSSHTVLLALLRFRFGLPSSLARGSTSIFTTFQIARLLVEWFGIRSCVWPEPSSLGVSGS